jgi:amidase
MMAGFAEYEAFDALGLAELVARRKLDPAALLDAAIERVERCNPKINALAARFYDRARRSIAEGLPPGPFRGVPFLLKDVSVYLSGTVTTMGSRLFRDRVADLDSTLVERYKRAGLVIFGKTTTPEMGLAASTETTLYGDTRNPWNLTRTAGGSSGGAAAAVASGIVPMAHGSDGGGSIRIPASACGLFGLKPTRARTPSGPLVGEGWGSLAVNHVLTRSVRDSAAMLDATHGPAPGDPYCAPPVARPFLSEVGADPGRLRIALQLEPFAGVPVHPECIAAARNAARLLESLGHEVEEARPEASWEELGQAMWVLVASNVSLTLKLLLNGREPLPGEVEHVTYGCIEAVRGMNVEAYPAAMRTIHAHGRRMARFHERYDLLMSPTLAKPPVPLGPQHMNNPDLAEYRRALLEWSPFTAPFNMSGEPSMSVPLHWTADGLPVGVLFSARFGEEATLFRLAGQLERACPWWDRRPDLAAHG